MPAMYTEERDPEEKTFTVEDAIEKIGFGFLPLKIYVICKTLIATDALEIMLLSLLATEVQCEWSLSEGQVAFISTAVFFGMAVASPVFGLFGDKFGRKVTLLHSAIWVAFFGVLTTFSPVYIWLLLLRGLVGVGMGGIPQGYNLIAEYIPSRYRAKLIVMGETFWCAGSLFEIMLAAFVTPVLGWRWLVALTALPVIVAAFGMAFVPESARYLVAAGERERALSILQAAAKAKHTSLPPGTLSKSIKQEPRGSPRDLFSPEYLRSTLLLWPMWFGVSFAYYGIVLASPLILSHEKDNATVLLVSFLLIDRIGRRKTGILLCVLAATFLALLLLKVSPKWLTFFVFGVRGTTLTAFNLSFVYTIELYPTTVRAVGLGICTGFARFASMVTPFFAQMMLVWSLPLTVGIYSAVCLVCGLLMLLMPIETKGRPLMNHSLSRSSSRTFGFLISHLLSPNHSLDLKSRGQIVIQQSAILRQRREVVVVDVDGDEDAGGADAVAGCLKAADRLGTRSLPGRQCLSGFTQTLCTAGVQSPVKIFLAVTVRGVETRLAAAECGQKLQ
ncbi:hypothetical protein BaRGS_00027185, partial [Batillaria attramentaria]